MTAFRRLGALARTQAQTLRTQTKTVRLSAGPNLNNIKQFTTDSNVGKPIPINILKEGQDPVELPDEEYPDWLWELTKPDETLSELERRKDTLTWENGGKRYFKLLNRKRIKEANARKKGY